VLVDKTSDAASLYNTVTGLVAQGTNNVPLTNQGRLEAATGTISDLTDLFNITNPAITIPAELYNNY